MKNMVNELIPAVLISLAGGLMAVMHKLGQAKAHIKLMDIVYELFTAIFTGFLVHCICCQFQATAPGTGFYMVAVAIAGYAARPILAILKDTIIRKLRAFLAGGNNGSNNGGPNAGN